jgi:hypothetical protein
MEQSPKTQRARRAETAETDLLLLRDAQATAAATNRMSCCPI